MSDIFVEVPVLTQLVEDNKYNEMIFKGMTRYETLDIE
jgi:hypothetical protein